MSRLPPYGAAAPVSRNFIAPAVDRADLDGFYAYLTSHSSYRPRPG